MDDEPLYHFFEIEKLDQPEEDIILWIGNDFENSIAYTKNNIQYKFIRNLKKSSLYDNDDISQALGLLYLVGMVGLSDDLEEREAIDFEAEDIKYSYILYLTKIVEALTSCTSNILKPNTIFSNESNKEEIEQAFKRNKGDTLLDFISNMDTNNKYYLADLLLKFKKRRDILHDVVKEYFDLEGLLKYKFVYLTDNGKKLYSYLIQKKVTDTIETINQTVNKSIGLEKAIKEQNQRTIEKVEELNKKNNIKIIEIVSILIAVFVLIVGNVSFLPQIASQNPINIACLILLINGSLLAGVSTLVQLVMGRRTDDVTTSEEKKRSSFYWFVMGLAGLLLALGILGLCFLAPTDSSNSQGESSSVDANINITVTTPPGQLTAIPTPSPAISVVTNSSPAAPHSAP